jgi:hypothetical protein
MPFVPAGANHATHVKALIEQRRSLSLGALVGFFLSDQDFNLLGEKSTDRGASACG